MRCTVATGSLRAATSPSSTTGTLAIIMPSVVPITTAGSASKRADSATVAICVLSPISAMKKAITVAPNTPTRSSNGMSSSSLSGISIHSAMAMKEIPSTQRRMLSVM
ncbi:hypothetical protein D3C85_1658620 [compost metagenome]